MKTSKGTVHSLGIVQTITLVSVHQAHEPSPCLYLEGEKKMAYFDVTAEKAFDGKGSDAVMLKLYSTIVEVNIFIPISDIKMILEFCSGKVMSFESGKSANSSVFWNRDESSGNILIGDDDITWDIGLTLDDETANDIIAELEELL